MTQKNEHELTIFVCSECEEIIDKDNNEIPAVCPHCGKYHSFITYSS